MSLLVFQLVFRFQFWCSYICAPGVHIFFTCLSVFHGNATHPSYQLHICSLNQPNISQQEPCLISINHAASDTTDLSFQAWSSGCQKWHNLLESHPSISDSSYSSKIRYTMLLLLFVFRDLWKEWGDSKFQIFSQNCQFHHRRLESLGHFNVFFKYHYEHYGLLKDSFDDRRSQLRLI